MVALIFGTTIVLILIWAGWKDNQNSKKSEAEEQRWLANANKTEAKIEFILSNGEIKNSPTYVAYSFGGSSYFGWRGTAKQSAGNALNNFYKNNQFIDSEGITYPACNIQSAKVIEINCENDDKEKK